VGLVAVELDLVGLAVDESCCAAKVFQSSRVVAGGESAVAAEAQETWVVRESLDSLAEERQGLVVLAESTLEFSGVDEAVGLCQCRQGRCRSLRESAARARVVRVTNAGTDQVDAENGPEDCD